MLFNIGKVLWVLVNSVFARVVCLYFSYMRACTYVLDVSISPLCHWVNCCKRDFKVSFYAYKEGITRSRIRFIKIFSLHKPYIINIFSGAPPQIYTRIHDNIHSGVILLLAGNTPQSLFGKEFYVRMCSSFIWLCLCF